MKRFGLALLLSLTLILAASFRVGLFTAGSLVPLAQASVFSDVTLDHPNYDAITYLQENGIVEGYSDQTFRPDQQVNRVEALKIILLGNKVIVPDIQPREIFPDVAYDAWYGKFVAKAKNLAIVSGDSNTGLFRPGDTVNLAEALKILLKTGKTDEVIPTSDPYADVPKDAWFASYFEYARRAKLLDQTSEEAVHPATPVTRGLLAELMYRLATSNFIVPDGKASYYGEKFHGKTTANGEVFDASEFTCAHRTYPFDTWLKVTNAENGKSVVVRVNDRGPYAGEDRIIDLSKAAFESISPLSRGIISVKVEETVEPVASEPETKTPVTDPQVSTKPSIPSPTPTDLLTGSKVDCPEAKQLYLIPKNTFEGLLLDKPIPNKVLVNEVITISGSVSGNPAKVSAFIVNTADVQTAFYTTPVNGRFSVNVRFPETGTFKLGLIPGEEGTSVVEDVVVLKNTCIEEVEGQLLPAVTGLELFTEKGDFVIRWEAGDYDLFKLTFLQGGLKKSYFLHNLTEWRPLYREFLAFKEGDATISLRGMALKHDSLVQPAQLIWSPAASMSFIAGSHEDYLINESEAELVSLTANSIARSPIRAVLKPKVDIRQEAAVILPSGKVETVKLTSSELTPRSNAMDIKVFPASDKSIIFNYEAQTTGLHIIEINNGEGMAVLNTPIYVRNQFPLLPNPRDLSDNQPTKVEGRLAALRSRMLELINQDRARYRFANLKLDTSLSDLAQYRSDDMVKQNYFGHWDRDGRSANDFRLNYGIQTPIGENLAQDITPELAEYGLMRSAIHRSNILSDEWTRVGIGISAQSDGSIVFVQIFSSDPIDLSDLPALRQEILERVNTRRASDFSADTTLNNLAQAWSDRMARDGFFDFNTPDGDSLVDSIRGAGITSALGTYIMGNSSFADLLDQLDGNQALTTSSWKKLGVGLRQDNLGILKVTLIYTE